MKNKFPNKMGGMNIQGMMAQAQRMQQNVQKAQEEITAQEVEATSGGGVVTVRVSGDKQIRSIKIKPEAVDPNDVEMLEDLILAALNEAINKADEIAKEIMNKATGGMNLGGLL